MITKCLPKIGNWLQEEKCQSYSEETGQHCDQVLNITLASQEQPGNVCLQVGHPGRTLDLSNKPAGDEYCESSLEKTLL